VSHTVVMRQRGSQVLQRQFPYSVTADTGSRFFCRGPLNSIHPFVSLPHLLPAPVEQLDQSNVHQMAACHIENQSLKSIFRHLIFMSFIFSRRAIQSNKNSRPQKFRRPNSGTSAAASPQKSQWVEERWLNVMPTLPSPLLGRQRKRKT